MTSVRIAAIADVHFGRHPASALQPIFSRLGDEADVLLLCGDLTDYGLPDEAPRLARRARRSRCRFRSSPCSATTTTKSARRQEVREILADAGVIVLDGDASRSRGVGFAGVKGFCGGFGRGALGAWGEPSDQGLRPGGGRRGAQARDGAGAPAHRAKRVAVLHYSPIAADGRGRAARDLPVPRIEPARGAADALPGRRRLPRPRPPRAASRGARRRRAGVQRLAAADAADDTGHAVSPVQRHALARPRLRAALRPRIGLAPSNGHPHRRPARRLGCRPRRPLLPSLPTRRRRPQPRHRG